MQGDIANPYGSINILAVLKAVRKHIPCLARLCVSVRERWNGCGDTGKRREREKVRATLQCSERSLAREHAEQRHVLLDSLEQDGRWNEQTEKDL